MWPSWLKSSPKISNASKPRFHSPNFTCSSFKDIEYLCNFQDISESTLKLQPSSPIPTPTRTCRSVFRRVRIANSLIQQWSSRSDPHTPKPGNVPTLSPTRDPPLPSEARIVVYYTSLRVVRPTFEACRAVMCILQGFQVVIDEKDLAMDLGFMSELRELLGLKPTEQLTLPQVFIDGRYMGGANEVRYLHEIGELKKLVSGIPRKKSSTCGSCGGYRFILCAECSGSHKIFSEKVGFRSCSSCNEIGLIGCPACSTPPLRRPMIARTDGSC